MHAHNILIVDDEPKVAFFFQKNLEMIAHGYAVTAVNSGQDALRQLSERPYDLMITDLRMPNMDGLELVRRAREISPQTKTVLITAYGSEDIWSRAQQLDISKALSKPIKIADLLTAVQEALSQTVADTQSTVLTLTGENFEELNQQLERLRIDLGSHVVLLCDTSGNLLTYAGSTHGLESSTLALLGGNMAAASELARHLHYPRTVHMSFFEGPPYDLYVANVDRHLFLTIGYDRGKAASRIGFVWHYTRRAIDDLVQILSRKPNSTESEQLDPEFTSALRDELDTLLTFEDEADLELLPSTSVSPAPAPAAVREMAPSKLYQTLKTLLDQFNARTRLNVNYKINALNQPLGKMERVLVVHTVTQALKNVYQHAQATAVDVQFKFTDGWLHGTIRDDGHGFNTNALSPQATLNTLAQQFKSAGGRLTIDSTPGWGTTIEFSLYCK